MTPAERHWLIIAGMAAITYALRAAPLILPWRPIDVRIEQRLRYLPPALFAALIVPSLLAPAGTVQGGVRLWAGLLGLAVGWRTRSIPVTILAGLGSFALLRWLVP
ncbi:MAG TPA: AzlD domain-containing protein [bacterium]|nr:AzlD domain-containing protein [bacterium]